jgi:hypothetical protein
LGEEIVANWRRSLERTMVSQAARPTPPPSAYAWPTPEEGLYNKFAPVPLIIYQNKAPKGRIGITGKVKTEESREREGNRSVSPAQEAPLVNGATSPAEPEVAPTSKSNSLNGICPLNVGLNNNVLNPANPLTLNEVMKSPFRFDDRSPFRFNEDPSCIVGRFGESLIPKGDPMEARLQEMLRSALENSVKISALN